MVDDIPVAARRFRWPGIRVRSSAGVADPSRGTRVAVGLPLLALGLAALWLGRGGVHTEVSLPVVVLLVALAAAAERIVVQLGPRSWYTASTPAIVLAALIGGPVAGLAAGVATQLLRAEAVWRRRLAEGGIATLQGLAAGVVGLEAWSGGSGAAALAAAAMASAVGVNSVGRLLVMLERGRRPLLRLWLRGVLVDMLETLLVIPLLAVLLISSQESSLLVVVTMAALLAGLAIAKRLRETTAAALATEQENARRDQLTGAPNRRSFEESLLAEHARIVRGGLPAGLFVVDIDRFKSINDRHGHRVGDQVLIEVVRRLTQGLRPSDVLARWGGEEITVLAPGVRGSRQLEQFGERIRALVATTPVPAGALSIAVTVSVGGTVLDGSVAPSVALHRADEALYDAKRTRDAAVISLPPRLALRAESA